MLLVSTTAYSQKKRKGLDVVSNIDVKVLAMKPLGNNSLAKNLQPIPVNVFPLSSNANLSVS